MAFLTACPVCSTGVYTDPAAPMAKAGSINPQNHSCVKTDTWRQRLRFGGSESRLRQRLVDTPDEALVAWPRVQKLKEIAVGGGSLTN